MYFWSVATLKGIGESLLVIDDKARVCWLGFNGKDLLAEAQKDLKSTDFEQNDSKLKPVFTAINDGRIQDVSVHLVGGTDFQRKVWKALLKIPAGQTVHYQDIANDIGHPKAVRAVGNAVGANPISLLVPCHRVVRKGGDIKNYRWGSEIKRKLLAGEKR